MFPGYLVLYGRSFYARGLVTLGVLGAGVGWLLGAGIGLVWTGAVPPRTTAEAWALRAFAVLFVGAGLATRWWIDVVPGTLGLGYHITARTPMQWSIWLDAALAAVTCLALAQTRFRREAIVVGAIAAIGIVIGAIAFVATGPCPFHQCDDLLTAAGR